MLFDVNAATNPQLSASGIDSQIYNAFVAALDLASIELVKIHGERNGNGAASQIRFDLAASYLRDAAVIHFRYDVATYFIDENGADLGNAVASVQVTARTTMDVSEAIIEQFGGTSGALMAHPYLRESIASTAQRIGFPGVLLPMIKQQPAQPAAD